MKRLFTTLFVVSACLCAVAQSEISLKDITSGRYVAQRPRGMHPHTVGGQYTQMNNDRTRVDIYSYEDGKQVGTLVDVADIHPLTPHTQHPTSITQIDDYALSPDGGWLLLQTGTRSIYRRSYTARYFLYHLQSKTLAPVADGKDIQCPVFSADGKRMAYVMDNNIYCFNTEDLLQRPEALPAATQVTHDGERGKVINGIPDWVYEEEFSFNCAMTFNRAGTELCWIKFDESRVKQYSLQLFKGERPALKAYEDYPGEYTYKYPKAGFDNSIVSAWTYHIATGASEQVSLPLPHEGYIPRILEGQDERSVYIYTMNRHQDTLCIHSLDASTGNLRTLLTEQVDKYINEDVLSAIRFTPKHILMASERDGVMQLYLYNKEGKLERQITRSPLIVTDVYGYDEATGDTYYQATDAQCENRAVYVTHKNGKTETLTRKDGWNSAAFSSDYRYFIHSWSDADTPWQTAVCNKKGARVKLLEDNAALRQKLQPLHLSQKRFFTFTTSEGVVLHGVMIVPTEFDETRRHPVVMYQYSGPGSQQVVNSWSLGSTGGNALFDHYLTQQGFIVVIVDGRGTGARGVDFEKCTYLHLGDKEAKDQVEAALWLGQQPYVDKDRIGIWGWSYGGFCTLMSMSEGRPVFKAGVAVAAPTNWKFYDTIYTERFMRTPKENPEGYATNPISRAANLHGALLLCHGLADDNVHPQNLFEYSERLVQEGKDFRELVYTNRNHSIYGGNTRYHLFKQIVDFFKTNLITDNEQ